MRLLLGILFTVVVVALGILDVVGVQKPKCVKWVKVFLVVCAGITGLYGFVRDLPKPAKPMVSGLEFYGMGPWFYCEFQARNAGDEECSVDGVEFEFPEAGIRLAKSANFLKGRQGGGRYGSTGVVPAVTCSGFPAELSDTNQQFVVIGSKNTREDWPDPLTVTLTFTSGNRRLPLVKKAASTLKNCELSNMEF